ncbi:glycosyl hydrolase family 28-related protein [Nannocystis sp.]|uniref:glycosyl hydrolase family 28-related protein n=1 Tax=Nannocystis sp. TaxID=1962667 RepID=UPI0025DE5E11|nr:glycosyl hydrolase family 28-related protein [Nannocystis sp.]MBK7828455.1 hypothetical protein [Nannocystis sp.]
MLRSRALLWLLLVACTSNTGGETSAGSTGSSGAVPGDSSGGVTTGASEATPTTGGAGSTSEATGVTTGVVTTATETGGGPDLPGAAGWRSVLYPEDWTPAFTGPEGRFLHDFSYAGYRLGATELAQDLAAKTIDVVADHGADAGGMTDATAAFQAAIDAAAQAGGAVVMVPAGLYRIDGVLTVSASRVVLRGVGSAQSRLWFTRFDGMSYKSHLNFAGALKLSDEALLTVDGESRSREITVADAGAYSVGDDVAVGFVITPEFVEEHAMTGTWMVFNDAWQVFFWRTVVKVEGDTLTLDVPLRYPVKLRDAASVRRVDGYLREVGVEDLGLANAVGWDDAWAQSQVHALSLRGVKDAWVRGVASYASPGAPDDGFSKGRHLQSGGIEVVQGKRVTIADTSFALAEHRGGGGNGYLFEVSQSSEVLVRDCVGDAGRHNFIQNWGFGATGIVWLRVHSSGGVAVAVKDLDFGLTGLSEFHHSLATANLIDESTVDDGWGAVNRNAESSGAGHSSTQSAVWNPAGAGVVRSRQFGHGYVIGPGPFVKLETSLGVPGAEGTEPEDFIERAPKDAPGPLIPASLYEDQLARRLGG